MGSSVEGSIFIMWRVWEKCLDGALGDSEEVAGFSSEVALVKRLTYAYKYNFILVINKLYPLSLFDSYFCQYSGFICYLGTNKPKFLTRSIFGHELAPYLASFLVQSSKIFGFDIIPTICDIFDININSY